MKKMNTEKIWIRITVEVMAVNCLRVNLEVFMNHLTHYLHHGNLIIQTTQILRGVVIICIFTMRQMIFYGIDGIGLPRGHMS